MRRELFCSGAPSQPGLETLHATMLPCTHVCPFVSYALKYPAFLLQGEDSEPGDSESTVASDLSEAERDVVLKLHESGVKGIEDQCSFPSVGTCCACGRLACEVVKTLDGNMCVQKCMGAYRSLRSFLSGSTRLVHAGTSSVERLMPVSRLSYQRYFAGRISL